MCIRDRYITDVIISVIVYLSAFSLAIRMMLSRKKKPHAHVEEDVYKRQL